MKCPAVEVPITIHLSWASWWWPYVDALTFFCRLWDTEPDPDKIASVAMRAMRVTCIRARQ